MTQTFIMAGTLQDSQGASLTEYTGICGFLRNGTDENLAKFECWTTFSFSDALVRVISNSRSDATTVTFRDNGADGQQSISITASTAGNFEDTTNTDTLTADDDANWKFVTGAGTGTCFYTLIATLCDDADGNLWPSQSSEQGGSVTTNPGDSHYIGFGGGYHHWGDDASVDIPVQDSTTFSDASIYVVSNGNSSASSVIFRDDGADTSLVITVTASGTGYFRDTTNSASPAAGSECNWHFAAGMGSHTDTGTVHNNICVHADSSVHVHASGSLNSGVSADRYISVDPGDITGDVTESDQQYNSNIARRAQDLQNYYWASATSHAHTIYFRINGANGNQSITHAAATTGSQQDTTNVDDFEVGDNINIFLDFDPSNTGNAQWGNFSIAFQDQPAVAAAGTNYDMRHYPRGAPRGVMRGAL